MRVFNVNGADKVSGQDRSVRVRAVDEAGARAYAESQGLLISDVTLEPAEATSKPPQRRYADGYGGMITVAHVLQALGALAVVCGVIVMFGAAESSLAIAALAAAAGVVTGVLLFALGEVLLCLREIAINTRR